MNLPRNLSSPSRNSPEYELTPETSQENVSTRENHPTCARHQQSHHESPLLRLPAELRNIVYEQVLSDATIMVCNIATSDAYQTLPSHLHYPRHLLQILQVCRQTYSETRTLILKFNKLLGFCEEICDYLEQCTLTHYQKAATDTIYLYSPGFCDCGLSVTPSVAALDSPVGEALLYLQRLQGLRKIVFKAILAEFDKMGFAEAAQAEHGRSHVGQVSLSSLALGGHLLD
ncbi:hypothetical protein HBI24_161430 [Parastagonospora nodorum]|nr:hypothetical protein HBI10_149160 [Parastagonospora nodorum]KAH4020113.1 hypothetical protein HBI13_122300 [Parastagonospora nodorum]KAH4259518.1 hypothetical protein HBI03_133790 [Parastagonospora nodorum]KAH4281628.1 hypothetical protein HBI04_041060 [Parastagonospora nodorum]KAH4311298.1 hypothetical protein HBI01_016670 [Parastagonospora nodorum]